MDDDRNTRNQRARLLIAAGHRVSGISSLADAPPQWPPHLYDLVIVTLKAETAGAQEFCEHLRKTNRLVRIAVLAGQPPDWEKTDFAPDAVILVEQTPTHFLETIAKLLAET